MSELTIKDIAKICNVGTSTVSRAINGGSGINKETKARILQVIEEYGFIPNNSARNLKIIESNTLAVLVKGMNNHFFQGMLDMFEKKLTKLSYTFMLQAVATSENELEIAEELIREKKLKGIIFLGGTSTKEETARRIHIPYVRCFGAINPYDCEYLCNSIGIDNVLESFRIVDYLCNMGHKRIAIICRSSHDNSTGDLRLKGYLRALEKHGIESDPELILSMNPDLTDYSIEAGYDSTKRLLESGVEFTALYVTADFMTFGAYKAIQERGLRIPEDYSVVGFDGIEMSRYFNPSLTTLEQPVEAIIDSAVSQLMKQIDGESMDNPILFGGKLLMRDSVKKLN